MKYAEIPEPNSLDSMEGQNETIGNIPESKVIHKIDTSKDVLKENKDFELMINWAVLGKEFKVSEDNPLGVIEWDKDKYSNHFYPESGLPKGKDHSYRDDSTENKFKIRNRVILEDVIEKIDEDKIKVLNARVLDYLLNNQNEIPEEWKDKRVIFLGTKFRRTSTIDVMYHYKDKDAISMGFVLDENGKPDGYTRYKINKTFVLALYARDEVLRGSDKIVTRWKTEIIDTDELLDLSGDDKIVYLNESD